MAFYTRPCWCETCEVVAFYTRPCWCVHRLVQWWELFSARYNNYSASAGIAQLLCVGWHCTTKCETLTACIAYTHVYAQSTLATRVRAYLKPPLQLTLFTSPPPKVLVPTVPWCGMAWCPHDAPRTSHAQSCTSANTGQGM